MDVRERWPMWTADLNPELNTTTLPAPLGRVVAMPGDEIIKREEFVYILVGLIPKLNSHIPSAEEVMATMLWCADWAKRYGDMGHAWRWVMHPAVWEAARFARYWDGRPVPFIGTHEAFGYPVERLGTIPPPWDTAETKGSPLILLRDDRVCFSVYGLRWGS